MSTVKKALTDVADAVDAETSVDIGAELAELRREVERVVAQLSKIGGAGAEKLGRAARHGLGDVKIAGDARDAITAEWASIEQRVRDETGVHPWRTLGIAVLGGLMLGLILRR